MNTDEEKNFYKVFHQEMEYNWKYLLNDYHIVPLLSGFENRLDKFIIVGVPFYLQRYCYETKTDVERDVLKWDDLGNVMTSFASEGSLKNQIKDSHLIYLRERYSKFSYDSKNIDMSAVFSVDRMASNRRIYNLMERMIEATSQYLNTIRFSGENMADIITRYAMHLEISPKLTTRRKYVGLYKSDYLKLIYEINKSMIEYYKRVHLWEIDDLYYALSDPDHFLLQFKDNKEYANVKLYLDTFRPYYEEMLEILIHFGNERVLAINTSDKFMTNVQKAYKKANTKPGNYLISILGCCKDYRDMNIPTSVQSMPLFFVRIQQEEGGTSNGCL